jgi:hypothetical protein
VSVKGAINASYVGYQGGKVKPFIDLGILTQPAGGNVETDFTFGPIFQVSFGVTF